MGRKLKEREVCEGGEKGLDRQGTVVGEGRAQGRVGKGTRDGC